MEEAYLVIYMYADFMKHPDEMVICEGKPECKPFLLKGILKFWDSILFLAIAWGMFIAFSKIYKSDLNWSIMYLIALIMIADGLFKAG